MQLDPKEVGYVAGAGAIGGAASLLYSTTDAAPPTIAAIPWSILAYPVLGAIAAILGVFLIARNDTKAATHCLAFAIACGLSWAAIFEGASALV